MCKLLIFLIASRDVLYLSAIPKKERERKHNKEMVHREQKDTIIHLIIRDKGRRKRKE